MDLFGQGNQIENLFVDSQITKPVVSKPKKNKNNKQDYATLMQSGKKAPFKCKNHDDLHMRVRTYTKNPQTCGSCGFKCEGKSGYISCPKTGNCFSLCSACRVCPKNHTLRNCISLRQFQSKKAIYGQNKFTCAGCQIEQQVGPKGVLHCPACNFSVCIKCITQYNKIWETKIQQSQKDEVMKQ